ncbi:subfamily B ATP-binding cassette protein MsbA [Sporomusaceae bacterium BoRhaA]|uniref:ABC transporter ATP-binding protein n=1 Tax=Pelorhabdus rhamnosifermentans TaxID=2772457 RepID=UPI001C05FB56|nr:ABC transporter ATP-binding protein [Pelorhabdus rhamnosifermentans]MBU2700499.1 subfamily B ATP-binding cassette protein MsbA [Pelorhabdus rhamnosifermentans]
MNLYLRLLSYVKPYILRIIVALTCTALAQGANLYIPAIVSKLIDKVLVSKDFAALNYITISIVVVIVLQSVFLYGQTYFMAYVAQKVVIDIRRAIYRHMQRLSLAFFESRQTGAIMSYITNDVSALQSALVDNVIDLVGQSVVLVGSIAYMFYIDWKLSLLTFISFPFIIQAINISGRKLRVKSRILQERAADITAFLQESISSIKIIQSFVQEKYELNRFDNENNNNFRAQMKTVQVSAVITPIINIFSALGITAIIWYGGREVIQSEITSGDLVAFIALATNLSNPVKRLSNVYGNIQRALAAAQRVFDVLDIKPAIIDCLSAVPLPPIKGQVEFHNVTFEYKPGEPVLTNLTFTANPGQMVALVGPSGAGKTTIANLIPRFYDPASGHITIDSIEIKTVTLESLRKQIGIVPQETTLFNGTIYQNILYGNLDATEEQVIAASKAANAHQFIMNTTGQYQCMIGERGAKLSGGQRQRIAIARAILKNPRVLILDEATSALDTESEALVQQALDTLMIGRTSFVIAHRLSTVQQADLILVMNKGQIVERGTHTELIAVGGLYSKLYNTQFKKRNHGGQPK